MKNLTYEYCKSKKSFDLVELLVCVEDVGVGVVAGQAVRHVGGGEVQQLIHIKILQCTHISYRRNGYSAVSVPAGLIITGGMDPGMKTNTKNI